MAGLRRDIGLIGAAFIALNGTVGAGIFAMPQTLVDGAGEASPYLILIFGVAMTFVALTFGELASRFETTGGPVVYTEAAFGRLVSFQAGWLYYLARIAATAANTNALLTYLAVFAPGADQGAAKLALIAVVLAILVAVNIAGVKGAVRVLNLVTLVKLTPLLLLAGWGLVAFGAAAPGPVTPSLNAAEEVGLLLLYAFIGFEMATLTAGETREAKRNMPRALVGIIVGMTLIYFLVQLAYVATMQGRTPEIAPLAAMAEILFGPWGAGAIAIAAMISIAGNVFASSIVTPRLTFAMAEAESLPKWFLAVHQRFATPANSILFFGVIGGALAMSGAFVWLAIMSALARLLVYLACALAALKLRRDAPGPKPVWGVVGRIAPVAAVALCVWAIAQAEPRAWIFVAGFLAVGLALYALARWRRGAASPI